MRILIGQSKVKEKVHALSSTQLSKLKEDRDEFEGLKLCFYAHILSYQGCGQSIGDGSPKSYSTSMRYT